MFVFKDINKTSTVIEQNVVHYTQNLTTASAVDTIKITSGSTNNKYWQSLNVLFYSSGSPSYGISGTNELKLSSPRNTLAKLHGKTFLTKYHGYENISLIVVPSIYYGEKIKEGSFQFTDISGSNVDNDGNNPIIIDDGFGNLYSTNAHHSQSVNSISSSDNYVGNIFYEQGLVVLTETGSWSGSVDYSDLATNYNLKFDSVNTIKTHEYSLTINPSEYNRTMNYTARSPISGSLKDNTKFLSRDFTGSFQPYITTINLYQQGDFIEPVIQARLPKPIRKSNKITTTFKIKLDI